MKPTSKRNNGIVNENAYALAARAARQAAWNTVAAGYAISTAKPVYAHPVFGYGSK